MITGWLVKLVLGIAVVGFAVIELGSPLWARAALDGAAHDAADAAAHEYRRTGDSDVARAAAVEEAEERGAQLTEFSIDDQSSEVTVTVFRKANSFLLDRFEQTKDWYEVSVEATSDVRQ